MKDEDRHIDERRKSDMARREVENVDEDDDEEEEEEDEDEQPENLTKVSSQVKGFIKGSVLHEIFTVPSFSIRPILISLKKLPTPPFFVLPLQSVCRGMGSYGGIYSNIK